MNMLSKSEVFAENKLFATLDTTVRKVVIENLPFLLSDTVGFIRKLPHHLVECFKSTLSEVKEADILMQVVDISHPSFEEQINVVNETLKDLGALDKPMIMVFNKVDAFHSEDGEMTIADFEKSWISKTNTPAIFISALNKSNLESFRKLIYDKVKALHETRYPNQNFLY
jgi:GTP-binding protein HflX